MSSSKGTTAWWNPDSHSLAGDEDMRAGTRPLNLAELIVRLRLRDRGDVGSDITPHLRHFSRLWASVVGIISAIVCASYIPAASNGRDVVTHWGVHGPDAMSSGWGILFTPIFLTVIIAVFLLIGVIPSNRGFSGQLGLMLVPSAAVLLLIMVLVAPWVPLPQFFGSWGGWGTLAMCVLILLGGAVIWVAIARSILASALKMREQAELGINLSAVS
ncbi:hypothetical protein [Actinomyces vulturis]|uniref:hypothetical protein n=1 Tax=Actinomyces vulturis TaxID=1857645 RepID=UPI00082D82A2|nr:hypothetical protein [Actinomyces vulturis]